MPVETIAAPIESSAPSSAAPVTGTTAPASADTQPREASLQPSEAQLAGERSPFAGQSIEDAIFKTLEEKRLARAKESGDQEIGSSGDRDVSEQEVQAPSSEAEEEEEGAEADTQQVQASTFDLNEPEITTKWLDDLAKAEKVKFADDATRDQFFKTVREHGEFKKVAEMFPDVDSAQEAQAQAANWMTADHVFSGAHTPEGTVNFIRYLMEREQENPILGDGQSVVRAMFDNMRAWDFEQYEKQFRSRGDEEGLTALEVLRERVSPNSSGVAGSEAIPPHPSADTSGQALARRVAAIQAKEQDLSRKEHKQQEQLHEQFTYSIAGDLDHEIGRAIEPALKTAAFSDAIQEACEEKICERILDVLDRNQLYQAQSQALSRKGISDENHQALMGLKMKYFNTVAPQIIRQTIREFGSPAVKAQAERDARQAAQEQRSRSEPKGVAAPATTPQAMNSPAQFVTRAIADLTKENGGRRPSQDQIIERVVLMKQQLRQQASRSF